MKKRLVCLMTALSLAIGLTGCALKERVETPDSIKTEENRIANHQKGSGAEVFAVKEENGDGFGSKKEEYDRFTYLEPYAIKEFPGDYVVYVPNAEDAHEFNIDKQYMVSGEGEGVTLLIMLISDIQEGDLSYGRLNAPIEDVIVSYAETAMDFLVALDDVEDYKISEVNKLGEDKATMTITHLRMQDGVPSPFFQVIDMFREGNDMITIAVQIDSELTTGHTDALLKEIEEYLEIPIEYDEEALFAAYEDLGDEGVDEDHSESIDTQYPQTVSTGFWEFTLPEDWKKVPQSDPYYYAYSPTGRENADTLVSIQDLGPGDLEYLSDLDMDELEYELNTETTDAEVDVSDLRIIEDSNLGYAFAYSLHTNVNGNSSFARVYLIECNDHIYMIMGMGDDDNPQGGDVADHIFETAKIIN
ncbi:MAG: hypothetical protein J1E61_07080 [Lachnospiraceae bacterium]|nr:hypothetical protein [Lachnospiraceae bacterium]